ncbi:Metallo-dependent phosphatase-like protein [Suillus fuscotomentosus]|uniref:Metallo-dependent phosphatase-like protein n=1 Tax=Suillus fuscotomentosus TaxID=1912939 RepID=A0AAD4EFG2_9AGAM|nr:Metallo-dependent phosphatase-like protein [Suillus fuscotomentosus]KAG1905071.1 Metallo-dependent phosphatase-like protein [Suillus fuscotomentosus]
MISKLTPAILLGLALCSTACAGDHLHARDGHTHQHLERREYPQVPLTPPYRPLVWGDLNVIHTTDTHGWLLGHQKTSWAEPYYSGDLGDFASFVTHMKQIALHKDVDLLLIDTGDLHDGTGLSDGYPPGDVDAHESNKFVERLPYDLMTIGNHELYVYADTYDMYTNFVPHLAGRYLTSNVNITVFNSDGKPESVPVGNRYTKFTTRKGRRITSLGVIFDFTGNDVNTTVQAVGDMVKEQWFVEAIAEEPDAFVLIGHMPVSNDSWPTVVNAVRAVHPLTPILIFGGHTHIRDCRQYDGRSMGIESGRYMETIGWMSADLDAAKDNRDNVTFTRRYLDQNRVTYEYHTRSSNRTFDTIHGRSITHGLQELAARFNLSYLYGTAGQDYTLTYNPYPSNGSLVSFFVEDAIPYALAINNTRASIPNIIIIDSWALRFDLLKGSFTKNDQLTIMPYQDSFLYIANVTSGIANQLLPAMNKLMAIQRKRDETQAVFSSYEVDDTRDSASLEEIDVRPGAGGQASFGYVTRDSCPDADNADDTLHIPLPHYPVPLYSGSNPPNVTADTPIDVVFLNSLGKEMIGILNSIQKDKTYTMYDVLSYSPTLTSDILGLYAQAMWN